MTLKEWAEEIPALRDEAKNIFGGEPEEVPISQTHYIRENGRVVQHEIYLQKWEYHIQQMLLSDDPSQYLRLNTPKRK